MVPSSNPGKGRNYFYSEVGDGGLNVTRIDGYIIAINNYVRERVEPFKVSGRRTIKPECGRTILDPNDP